MKPELFSRPLIHRCLVAAVLMTAVSLLAGCTAPIGADLTTAARAYRQIHDNPVSHGQPGQATRSVLHRFQQTETFNEAPDDTLRVLREKVVAGREREILFALAELNYLAAERLRRGVKAWEARDARDYYLDAAIHAWLFLFGEADQPPPGKFDERFRTACDLYNYALGWALTRRDGTNAVVELAGGDRHLPGGQLQVDFTQPGFPWPLAEFDEFVLADHFLVRGLSVRNRQPGMGAPLVAVTKPDGRTRLPRGVPATVFLRVQGNLADLGAGRLRASLELYATFDVATVRVGEQEVPLETDTTIATAYGLNNSFVWKLGRMQFLSGEEQVPTDVYLTHPYRPGRIPVVFVHGTFSSPVWWAEMGNALAADPELRRRYQFWFFIYNSGNPIFYSAARLRDSLRAKVQALDPEGRDAALRQMVVIGHSQGGLLTKLTATDTGERLLAAALGTNRLERLGLAPEKEAEIRRFTCYEALPFVKRVVFISTPHRGSYRAGGFVRRLARRLVSLPASLARRATELAGLTEKLNLPKELRHTRTSLDGMSPRNPSLLALADIPLAPGIQGHSIIAVQGDGDYRQGKDGLVAYDSAHVDYVESEFIVRSFHSCQDKPPTIEEVRRILHEHLRTLPDTARP